MVLLGCRGYTTSSVLTDARLFPKMSVVFIFAKEPIFGFVGPPCGACVASHNFLLWPFISISTPPSSVLEFLSLHILTNTCFCLTVSGGCCMVTHYGLGLHLH